MAEVVSYLEPGIDSSSEQISENRSFPENTPVEHVSEGTGEESSSPDVSAEDTVLEESTQGEKEKEMKEDEKEVPEEIEKEEPSEKEVATDGEKQVKNDVVKEDQRSHEHLAPPVVPRESRYFQHDIRSESAENVLNQPYTPPASDCDGSWDHDRFGKEGSFPIRSGYPSHPHRKGRGFAYHRRSQERKENSEQTKQPQEIQTQQIQQTEQTEQTEQAEQVDQAEQAEQAEQSQEIQTEQTKQEDESKSQFKVHMRMDNHKRQQKGRTGDEGKHKSQQSRGWGDLDANESDRKQNSRKNDKPSFRNQRRSQTQNSQGWNDQSEPRQNRRQNSQGWNDHSEPRQNRRQNSQGWNDHSEPCQNRRQNSQGWNDHSEPRQNRRQDSQGWNDQSEPRQNRRQNSQGWNGQSEPHQNRRQNSQGWNGQSDSQPQRYQHSQRQQYGSFQDRSRQRQSRDYIPSQYYRENQPYTHTFSDKHLRILRSFERPKDEEPALIMPLANMSVPHDVPSNSQMNQLQNNPSPQQPAQVAYNVPQPDVVYGQPPTEGMSYIPNTPVYNPAVPPEMQMGMPVPPQYIPQPYYPQQSVIYQYPPEYLPPGAVFYPNYPMPVSMPQPTPEQ